MLIKYVGLFINEEDIVKIHNLEKPQLPFVNDEIHCTFKYRPECTQEFNKIIGKEYTIILTHYGNDGNNSGFLVELPQELESYYINTNEEGILKYPHITASLNANAEANNTINLDFEKLIKPIKVRGKMGYWVNENDNEYKLFKSID